MVRDSGQDSGIPRNELADKVASSCPDRKNSHAAVRDTSFSRNDGVAYIPRYNSALMVQGVSDGVFQLDIVLCQSVRQLFTTDRCCFSGLVSCGV